MRLIFYSAVLLFGIVALSSCKKTFDPGTTVSAKMANGWYSTFTVGGQDIYGLGTQFFSTYNTSENDDSIWLDDHGNFWDFKVKAAADYSKLSFQSSGSVNNYYLDTVIVTNGIILPKAGHSLSGNPTDSIYMEVQFSDDSPSYGTTYVISGTARTGFVEDDY